jgi:hypothetical protein
MPMIRLAAFAVLFAAAASPALAYPNCLNSSNGARLHVEFGIGTGNFTEQDQMDFDLMQARAHGIDAETAERTHLDCVKITRIEDGRWVTEYYDPRSWDFVPTD